MAFVKLVKGKPYFKRFQTKYRRRREGKTDYQARKALIFQDKDKYNSPKYRLVVRLTNQKVICQVIYATLKGDRVLASADSYELKRFGLTAGLSNYPAAYATGLLVARRLLKQLKMDKYYPGNSKVDGALYDVSEKPNEERRPFLALLDIGLVRTTIGNRVFGSLKGATDGGLYVPHNNKRFPGFSDVDGKEKYNADAHRDRIFGKHIDNYMKLLKDKKGVEAYNKQFSLWDASLQKSGAKTVQDLIKRVHDEIRKSSDRVKRGNHPNPKREQTKFKQVRLTVKQRKENVQKRIKIALQQSKKKQAAKK